MIDLDEIPLDWLPHIGVEREGVTLVFEADQRALYFMASEGSHRHAFFAQREARKGVPYAEAAERAGREIAGWRRLLLLDIAEGRIAA